MNHDFGKQHVIRTDDFDQPVVACAFHAVFEDILDCLHKPAVVALNDDSLRRIHLNANAVQIHCNKEGAK